MIDDDKPGRYGLLGRDGELLQAVLIRLVVCTDCGAVVRDTEAHDRWHSTR